MTWMVGKPAGSILCAFELAQDVSRNDAVLKAGRLYMSFPVFTKEGLEEMRLRKSRYEVTFKKHTDSQKEELEKVNEAPNLLMKALHFQRAVAANERASIMRTNAYDNIPSNDEDIITIGDGLLLMKKGSVYLQKTSDTKKGVSTKVKDVYVGDAFLKK